MAFLNTPLVVNVIPAMVSAFFGSLITYWLLNRKEKHKKKEHLKEFDVALDMIRMEIEDNLMRYTKANISDLKSFVFKTHYWEKYQTELYRYYPDIYKDYLFYYNTALDTFNNKNVNCFKILAVGYNLVNRLYEPNKKYIALSTQFHPRYKGEEE